MIRDAMVMATRSETVTPPGRVVAVGRDDVERAVAAGVIGSDQADALWTFLIAKSAVPDARGGHASISCTCSGTPAP
jgi:hypothetical protein